MVRYFGEVPHAAVVAILNSGTSKNTLAMHLMRCLAFFRAHCNIFLFAEHIPEKENIVADSLLFFQVCPSAARNSTRIPEELVQAMVLVHPDWTAPTWRALFLSKRSSVVNAKDVKGWTGGVFKILYSVPFPTPPVVGSGGNHVCVLLWRGRVKTRHNQSVFISYPIFTNSVGTRRPICPHIVAEVRVRP